MKSLKEIYKKLYNDNDLYRNSIERELEKNKLTTLLTIVNNGQEYIYHSKFSKEYNKETMTKYLEDCIYFNCILDRFYYFNKVARPLHDLNATSGFVSVE